MALIYEPCDYCNQNIEMYVGQNVSGNQLVWYLSYRCHHCGAGIELDDTGDMPDIWRSAILAQEGTWNLTVLETGKSATVATKILRATLLLSLDEAMQLKKKMPGSVFTGTHAEADWLRQILVAKNLNAFANKIIT